MGPGRRRHPPCGGGSRSTWREGGTGKVSSSRRRSHAVHREGGCDLGGVIILRTAEGRGPPGGRAGPRRRHPRGGGGSRSSGKEVGTGEVSSSTGRQRIAVHREGGRDRGGVFILRAAEARGPPGGRAGPGRRRHPTGGGATRSTGREGATGEASSSSGRRRLAVHRDGGRDRGGVILRAAEGRCPPGGRAGPEKRDPPGGVATPSTGMEGGTGEASSSSGRRRLAVYRERGWDRGGVILRAAEARGPPRGRAGPGRHGHPPGGGGSRSTGRELEGRTGEASLFSGRWRLAVHWEEGEARGPPGERVGPGRSRHHPGGGGSRSTRREGGTGEASSSGWRWLAVHREGGWARGGVVMLSAAEARGRPGGRAGAERRYPFGGGGSRSTGREGATGEVSSSSGRGRLAVHREGGRDRGGVILRAAEARGPPGGMAGPGRRHPSGGGGTRSTGREGETGEASSSSWRRRLAVHRERGRDRGGVILRAADARVPPRGRAGPGRFGHSPGGGGSRSTGRDGGTGEVSSSWRRWLPVQREGGRDRGGVILRAAEASGPP